MTKWNFQFLINWTSIKHILNYGEIYKDMFHHRSYVHKIEYKAREIKAWKTETSGSNGIRNHDSAMPVQCSTNWTIKPSGSWYTRRWWKIQVNIWDIIYLNCRERYEDMTDHRSYAQNLSSCGIRAWKKFRPKRDFNHDLCYTSERFTNWAIKPTERWSPVNEQVTLL